MANIRGIIQEKKKFYKKIGVIYCPILDTNVYFSGDGFYHLLHKSNGTPRKINSQYQRLKTLKFAPKVVSDCKKIFRIEQRKVKIKGKLKKVLYYTLIHEVYYKKRVKLIIEKIGKNGKLKFRSIMPQGKWYKKKRHK